MGLCKCPKRQVSNQFCYEHRVIVCESCMIQNHSKCIVQSYLNWLKDCDYVSCCTLCQQPLEAGNCVRLICFHIFHWDCLNARQAALPANTAPGGHQCPTCNAEIFPKSNLVSQVAEKLKKSYLSKVNWGRNGLALSLLPNEHIPNNTSIAITTTATTSQNENSASTTAGATSNLSKTHHHSNATERLKSNGAFATTQQKSPHSVLLMDAFNPPIDNEAHASSRRPLLPRQTPIGGSDHDENKYRRRTPAEIFSRWSRRFYAPSSRPPWRRTWFLVASGIFAFILLIYLMALFGRSESEYITWNKPNPMPNNDVVYN